MKRFTETQKWEDPWFRRLPVEMKLLWQWLCDRCDNAGVIDPDLELASFQIGYQYPIDTLSQFDGRLVQIGGGKWFIPKFIEFQYGTLSQDCKAHRPIFVSLKKHQIKGYPKGIHSLQEEEEEKDKEKDKEKEQDAKKKTRIKTNPKLTRVASNTPTMCRMNAWFSRRPETLWTIEQERTLEQIDPSEAELDGMERFYLADEHADAKLYRRTNLTTLLNNWHDELDKARNYLHKNNK